MWRCCSISAAPWRKLDEAQQAQAATREGAVALMAAQPSLIKRRCSRKTAAFMQAFKRLFMNLFFKK